MLTNPSTVGRTLLFLALLVAVISAVGYFLFFETRRFVFGNAETVCGNQPGPETARDQTDLLALKVALVQNPNPLEFRVGQVRGHRAVLVADQKTRTAVPMDQEAAVYYLHVWKVVFDNNNPGADPHVSIDFKNPDGSPFPSVLSPRGYSDCMPAITM